MDKGPARLDGIFKTTQQMVMAECENRYFGSIGCAYKQQAKSQPKI